MNRTFQTLSLASVLAISGFAWAQSGMPQGHAHHMGEATATRPGQQAGMGERDNAMRPGPYMRGEHRMLRSKQRMAQHEEMFKAQLQLSASQEAAWTEFMAALKKPMHSPEHKHPDMLALAKMSTPERIDTLGAQRSKHLADMQAGMSARGQAMKTFYAVLAPDQQKVFDALSLRWMGGMMSPRGAGHRGGHGESGHHGGGHHDGAPHSAHHS